MSNYSQDTLAQLGSQLRQAIDVDGLPLRTVHEQIGQELKNRCKNDRVVAGPPNTRFTIGRKLKSEPLSLEVTIGWSNTKG